MILNRGDFAPSLFPRTQWQVVINREFKALGCDHRRPTSASTAKDFSHPQRRMKAKTSLIALISSQPSLSSPVQAGRGRDETAKQIGESILALGFPVAPLASAEFPDCLEKVFLPKVRPEFWGHVHLRVGKLPEKEIGNSHFP